jgi:hypothetical protein
MDMPSAWKLDYWREKVFSHIAEGRGKLPVATIHKRLKAEAQLLEESREPDKMTLARACPSYRTVVRREEEYWKDLTKEQQMSYANYRWPQSILAGALPLEAASAAAELLRFCLNNRFERPTVKLVEWFWTVTCFAPDAPFLERLDCTRFLAALEILHRPAPL